MHFKVASEIRLSGYPPALYTKLTRLFTMENPKALEAERLGRRFDLADRCSRSATTPLAKLFSRGTKISLTPLILVVQ